MDIISIVISLLFIGLFIRVLKRRDEEKEGADAKTEVFNITDALELYIRRIAEEQGLKLTPEFNERIKEIHNYYDKPVDVKKKKKK